jgi:hypothetical protein
MNIHNKRFMTTLICLLLIIVGAVIFMNKRTQTETEKNFVGAFTIGAIVSKQECATQYWGAARYEVIRQDSSQMTEEEEDQLYICINQ